MSFQHQTLGTIIASVLEYDELCQSMGEAPHVNNSTSTYAPCDGRSILGSQLSNTGLSNVPDLRGRFLRGLNTMYNHGEVHPLNLETADPDGEHRMVGDYQADEVKSHKHSYTTNSDGNPNGPAPDVPLTWARNGKEKRETDQGGGKESRPRNVAVYYYIRIN